MGLLDSLSDGINKGIGQTDRMLQIGRVKSSLGALSKNREGLYASLGKHVYESNRRSTVPVDGIEPFVSEIRSIELEMARLESELEAGVEGRTSGIACQACGAGNALGAAFCVSCGSKIEIASVELCSHCQAPIPAGGGFCTRCGTPTETNAAPSTPLSDSSSTEVTEAPARFCSSCGESVADGLRFCPKCGTAA